MAICTQDAVAPKTEEEDDVIIFSIHVLHCWSELSTGFSVLSLSILKGTEPFQHDGALM